MANVADYIVDEIYRAGAHTAFLVTGGYAMHLHDAIRRHGKMKYVCCHHEQAAAMAAEAYGRASGKIGVAFLTAGPGALNALNGVVGAYLDSAPTLYVVGQLKTSLAQVRGPRQFGFQGFATLGIAAQVTKYAVQVTDAAQVAGELAKCLATATAPRRGPVWLEVPLDVQNAPFENQPAPPRMEATTEEEIGERDLAPIVAALKQARRPLILAGAGVRASGAVRELLTFVERFQLPVMTSRNGMDLLPEDHPQFVGRPGIYGSRTANFAVTTCDLLISVGCRLEIMVVGHDFAAFAPNAQKIVVDIDAAELNKPSFAEATRLRADAGVFLRALSQALGSYRFQEEGWFEKIREWKRRYPTVLPEYRTGKGLINSYYFFETLSREVAADAQFVIDACHAIYSFPQSFPVKAGQRHFLSGGLATMGYLPAAIGVAEAGAREVYAVCGDGSLQMNIQELQTIAHYRLPIKIIVLNNNGYLLIKATQQNLQGGRIMGASPQTGVSFPSLAKIAAAYGLPHRLVESTEDVAAATHELAQATGPLLFEARCLEEQLIAPRIFSEMQSDGRMVSHPYDDMFPKLGREEYRAAKQID